MAKGKQSARRGPTRRSVVGGLAVATVLLPAARRGAQAQAAPAKIGFLNTLSGGGARLGTDNFNGMSLYFERIGWQAGGRRIELIKEDDQFNPQVGLEKLRKLTVADQVDIVVGPQASSVAMAALGYVKENKVFLLVSGAGTDAITWERLPYLFRSSISITQKDRPIGGWIYDNVGKEAVLAASDFVAGRDVLRVFKDAFAAKGGKVLREIYPPLNTNDFSPYLADMRTIGAPVAFVFFPGADAVRFIKQYAEYGLGRKTRLAGDSMFEADTLPATAEAAIGGLTSNNYAESLASPENQRFQAEYKAKFGEVASFYAEYGFVAAQVIAATLDATKGNTDKDQLARAMAAVRFNAPRGPFRFDAETHNVIQNIYIKEIVKVNDRITDKVLLTFPDVRDPGVRS